MIVEKRQLSEARGSMEAGNISGFCGDGEKKSENSKMTSISVTTEKSRQISLLTIDHLILCITFITLKSGRDK